MPDTPIPTHPEWWVIRTPLGHAAVAYRPNTRCGVIGPFSSKITAAIKIDELEARTIRRREAFRVAAMVVSIVALTVIALEVLA